MERQGKRDEAASTTWGYVAIALGTLLFIVGFVGSSAASMLGLPDVSSAIWIGLGLVVVGFIILTGDEPTEDDGT